MYHKTPAREYAILRKDEKYSEDQAMQDFKEIRRELASFNTQMMKVLEDKDGQEGLMADILVRIELRNRSKHFFRHSGMEDD